MRTKLHFKTEKSTLTDLWSSSQDLSKNRNLLKVFLNLKGSLDQVSGFTYPITNSELIKTTITDGSTFRVTSFTTILQDHGRMKDWISFFSTMNISLDRNYCLSEHIQEPQSNTGLQTNQSLILTMQMKSLSKSAERETLRFISDGSSKRSWRTIRERNGGSFKMSIPAKPLKKTSINS